MHQNITYQEGIVGAQSRKGKNKYLHPQKIKKSQANSQVGQKVG
jgi:hypothetical protein